MFLKIICLHWLQLYTYYTHKSQQVVCCPSADCEQGIFSIMTVFTYLEEQQKDLK